MFLVLGALLTHGLPQTQVRDTLMTKGDER